jgi:arabinose-5-phosphate isomerase
MTIHKQRALRVLKIEAEAISSLIDQLDDQFDKAIDSILTSDGRVIVCGMGKSGIIGNKISATLASTGTPSFSMHPGEAFHGDLGMVLKDDVFLAISNSGETEEVLKLLPFLKDNGNVIIALTGNVHSTLARESHFHLSIAVPNEACPLKLAPTASTTATLAMGDAIAIALMEANDFKPENFARFHPGGNLGKRLLLKVEDDMVKENLPTVLPSAKLAEVIGVISAGEQGMTVVVDNNQLIIGLITDGDLRRGFETFKQSLFDLTARDIMSVGPMKIDKTELAAYGRDLMEKLKINKLLVSENGELVGILRK